jgi:hypothetical protein
MTNANNLVVGGSGYGKTYFCKNYIIPQYAKSNIPVMIYDTKGYDFKDVSDVLIHDPYEFVRAYKDGHTVMRYDPPHAPTKTDDMGEIDDRFYKGASAVLKYAKYIHTVRDEVHEVSRSNHIYSKAFSRYWKKGRGYGASGTGLTQESTDLKKSLINNSNDIFVFNTDGLHDKILSKLDVSMSDVESLGVGEFFHYNKMRKKTVRHDPI